MADSGTGRAVARAAAIVAIAADVGWMYMCSGVSAPDDEWGTPDPTVGVGEISGSRGLVPCNIARVHDPSRLCVHDLQQTLP